MKQLFLPHLTLVGLKFSSSAKLNCIVLKEYLAHGQRCKKFSLLLMNKKHEVIKKIEGTTIGHKRIITFPGTNVDLVRLTIDKQKAPTLISEIEAYLINERLIENNF
jgi:hypothetical protein